MDRFSDEYGVDARKENVGGAYDMSVTSIEEQEENNGFLKTSMPVGNDGRIAPDHATYKLSGGQAGAGDNEYNEAATSFQG